MGNIFNQDFIDFIDSLNKAKVEYILVGGYAVILHGYNRTTGDLDVWINPTKTNYNRLIQAFSYFGLPTNVLTLDDFLDTENFEVFTFGRPPVSIDIMTKVKGLSFIPTFDKSIIYETNGVKIRLIHYNGLIEAKKSSARLKDLNDI